MIDIEFTCMVYFTKYWLSSAQIPYDVIYGTYIFLDISSGWFLLSVFFLSVAIC